MGRIEEIKKRLEKATPGPWKRVFDECGEEEMIEPTGYYGYGKQKANVYADGDLIANAPDDLRFLLAELARTQRAHIEAIDEGALAAESSESRRKVLLWLISPDGPLYGVDGIVLDRINAALLPSPGEVKTDACLGCGCLMERCRQHVAGGAVACCPDCQHVVVDKPSAGREEGR